LGLISEYLKNDLKIIKKSISNIKVINLFKEKTFSTNLKKKNKKQFLLFFLKNNQKYKENLIFTK